jgi:streptogramin lyase
VLIMAVFGAGLAGIAPGQVVTEFPIPTASSVPTGIAAGPDGNLWFTAGDNIGRITTAGVITEFLAVSGPGIAAGPDGNLWFTAGDNIGRITTAGVITEFPIPTAGSDPFGITAGADGNLWFTENFGNKIGRITTGGIITEFPTPTAVGPRGIAAGPDGNLWFAEFAGRIGQITTTGAITEFPIPTASFADGITAGPDGNLWFTEDNKIGRITMAGVITEFPVFPLNNGLTGIAAGLDGNLWFTNWRDDSISQITTEGVVTGVFFVSVPGAPVRIAAGPDGNLWFSEYYGDNIGRITTAPTTPQPMAVDAHPVTGSISNTNGVLEPGETVQVAPSWKNTLTNPQAFTGTASNLTGPTGPTYTIVDSTADYGTIGAGVTADCDGATGDCYLMTVSGNRPATHWDATFTEDLSSNSISKVRTLHVGESFPDVPTSNQFYRFIENLFHNGVTEGCAGGNYCPTNSVTRAQMAVFLMKSNLGATEMPPPATGTVFADVPASNPVAPWIEQLAGFKITGGCGAGNYCPDNPVTRAQMAVFLLKAEHGSSYAPPNCAGTFGDVACPSQFANWIEQLFHEGITGGCGNGNYCPNSPSTRGQMAVFLVKSFGLQLYGP